MPLTLSGLYRKFISAKIAEATGADVEKWYQDAGGWRLNVLEAQICITPGCDINIRGFEEGSQLFIFLAKIRTWCRDTSIEDLCRIAAEVKEEKTPTAEDERRKEMVDAFLSRLHRTDHKLQRVASLLEDVVQTIAEMKADVKDTEAMIQHEYGDKAVIQRVFGDKLSQD